jgi:hypothetical protein
MHFYSGPPMHFLSGVDTFSRHSILSMARYRDMSEAGNISVKVIHGAN